MDARDGGRSGCFRTRTARSRRRGARLVCDIGWGEDFLFRILEKLRTNLAKVEIESFRCAAGQGDDAVYSSLWCSE